MSGRYFPQLEQLPSPHFLQLPDEAQPVTMVATQIVINSQHAQTPQCFRAFMASLSPKESDEKHRSIKV